MLCLRESGVELCRIARIDCNQFESKGFRGARHIRQDRRRRAVRITEGRNHAGGGY